VFAETAAIAAEVGWAYDWVGELPAVRAANLRWLAGYRHPRFADAAVMATLAEVFAEPGPLRAGAARVGDPVAVLPVLFAMLWRGMLAAELDSRVLDSPRPVPPPPPRPVAPSMAIGDAVRDATGAIYHALRAGTWIPGRQQRLRQLAPAPGIRPWPACSAPALAGQTMAPAVPSSRSRYTPTLSGSPHAPFGRKAPATARHREAPRRRTGLLSPARANRSGSGGPACSAHRNLRMAVRPVWLTRPPPCPTVY
jgi:hypothetical protein